MEKNTEKQEITMKTGVVDVGGGLRGIYAAGVLDYCMEHGIRFDLGIGVSAGSANLASYAAGQIGRNYKFYTEYAFRRQYMGIGNFIFKHSFIDMDYVYGTLCRADGEYPLDYPSLRDNPMEFYVVAADARTGQAKYFDKGVALAQEYAKQGKVLIISPDDICGVDTLKKDKASLHRLYEKGYQDGQKILNYLWNGR